MRPRTWAAAVALATVAALTSPAAGRGEEAENGIVFARVDPKLSDYGYVAKDRLWTGLLGSGRLIDVCWDNFGQAPAADRLAAEAAVRSTWPAVADINFVGWGACASPTAKGVHLMVYFDQTPARSLIGKNLNGVRHGVWLNFTAWDDDFCTRNRGDCIRSQVIHEFGHVLGLHHEQLRADAPAACKAKYRPEDDDSLTSDATDMGTPYDPASVMNYCSKIYHQGLKLSDGDIAVARELYGRRLS